MMSFNYEFVTGLRIKIDSWLNQFEYDYLEQTIFVKLQPMYEDCVVTLFYTFHNKKNLYQSSKVQGVWVQFVRVH